MLKRRSFVALSALAAIAPKFMRPMAAQAAEITAKLQPKEARAIARQAYIYGFPLVDSYRIQYSYFVDRDDQEFKGDWNTLHNTARVYTPDDKAIQTPNFDTPYSALHVDADHQRGSIHATGRI